MADKKITQLTEKIVINGTEELVVASNHRNFKVKSQAVLDMIQGIPTKASLGLGNVDNTSDANKPLSTLTQEALDAKAFLLHNHPVDAVEGLEEVLNGKMDSTALLGKADVVHSHSIAQVTGLQTALNSKATPTEVAGKADITHTHAVNDITGLQAALDDKANAADVSTRSDTVHNHAIGDINVLQTDLLAKAEPADLAAKAALVHEHIIEEVIGLQTLLDSKANVGHTHVTLDVTDLQTAIDGLENEFVVFDGYASIKGPSTVYAGISATFQITNNDSFNLYTLSANNGSVSAANDVITYTPSIEGPGGFTINGRNINVTVVEPGIVTPTLTAPADGAIDLGPNLLLTASAFSSLPEGNLNHSTTDWELATDVNFTNVVYSSLADNVNLTSITVTLTENTVYYARVRYHSGLSVSNWSPVIDFMSKASYFPSNESAILTASDKAADDWFGISVAIDASGLRVVIGASNATAGGSGSEGKAYVFVRSGSTWTEEAILTASNLSGSANFGISVSITDLGDRVAIGSSAADPGSISNAGAVYVFSRSGMVWTEEQILSASDKAVSDSFGKSVSLDSDATRIIIGAHLADPASLSAAGKAYVFTRSGTTWTEEQVLTAGDKVAGDQFGNSVAVASDGSRAVIGANKADSGLTDSGKAYVFVRSGTTWTQEQVLSASDKAASDQFGASVAIDGTGLRVIIGAYLADPASMSSAGKAYVFTRSGTTWTEEAILTASDKSASDQFGVSVSTNSAGDRILVGAQGADPNGSGKAYLITRTGTVWTEVVILSASDQASFDAFGFYSDITNDGTIIAVSSMTSDPGGVVDAGKVYIFS